MDLALRERLVIQSDQPLHNDYAFVVYRAKFGDRCVTAQLLPNPDSPLLASTSIHHPNVLQNWGVTEPDDQNQCFSLQDCINCNLNDLPLEILSPHPETPGPLLLDILRQTLFTLDVMRHHNLAHGHLASWHIGLLFLPHGHNAMALYDVVSRYSREVHYNMAYEGPKVEVKLKTIQKVPGSEDAYLKDLKDFCTNLVLPPFDSDTGITCPLADDLRWKIFQTVWPNDGLMDPADRLLLSRRLILDFVGRPQEFVGRPYYLLEHPIFWLEIKSVDFLADFGEFIGIRYLDKYAVSGFDVYSEPPGILVAFLAQLRKLDYSKWRRRVNGFVLACGGKSTRYRSWDDADSIIGLLRCIRHLIRHFQSLHPDDRVSVGKVDCYDYIHSRFPQLILHCYNTLLLHYEPLCILYGSAFEWTFMRYVPSGCRGLGPPGQA